MAEPASSSCGPASCTPHDTATTARKVRENQSSPPLTATLAEPWAVTPKWRIGRLFRSAVNSRIAPCSSAREKDHQCSSRAKTGAAPAESINLLCHSIA